MFTLIYKKQLINQITSLKHFDGKLCKGNGDDNIYKLYFLFTMEAANISWFPTLINKL